MMFTQLHLMEQQPVQYADLAEIYRRPDYEAGTVVKLGGEAVLATNKFNDPSIWSSINNPAYLMNSEAEGVVALQGFCTM